jgi:G3E family GTPase
VDEVHQPIPLTILTGFLGAGKTTLLNHILTGDHGRRVGVLVNDFGSVNVDAELVVDVKDGVISLANGCVCCQIRDDLVDSVAELIDRDEPVDHVVLEASGVADPAGIYLTFVDSAYRDQVRLDSVDLCGRCRSGTRRRRPRPGATQAAADRVRRPGHPQQGRPRWGRWRAAVKRWIDANFTRVRLVPAIHCDVPLDVLLAVGRFDPTAFSSGGAGPVPQDHGHGSGRASHGVRFSTQSYVTANPYAGGRSSG